MIYGLFYWLGVTLQMIYLSLYFFFNFSGVAPLFSYRHLSAYFAHKTQTNRWDLFIFRALSSSSAPPSSSIVRSFVRPAFRLSVLLTCELLQVQSLDQKPLLPCNSISLIHTS